MPNPFVLIGTPCYGGLVHKEYMESILTLMAYAPGQGINLTLALLGNDSLITRSRNKIVATFLDMPQATHLLFIDADISFKPEAVKRLLDFDQELVAGMYPIKAIDWPKLHKRAPGQPAEALPGLGLNFVGQPFVNVEREERDGFVTGTYAGCGFMMIKRSCLEKMIAAYPETKFGVAQTFPRTPSSDNSYALFDCIIEPESRIYLSEDFAFCNRWRKIGGKIWLDTLTRLGHTGSAKFEGNPIEI